MNPQEEPTPEAKQPTGEQEGAANGNADPDQVDGGAMVPADHPLIDPVHHVIEPREHPYLKRLPIDVASEPVPQAGPQQAAQAAAASAAETENIRGMLDQVGGPASGFAFGAGLAGAGMILRGIVRAERENRTAGSIHEYLVRGGGGPSGNPPSAADASEMALLAALDKWAGRASRM